MVRTAILIIIFLRSIISPNACSQDINNPFYCYKYLQLSAESPIKDSVIIAKSYYDPLPEFNKTTKLTIEHYVPANIGKDLIFKFLRGPADYIELNDPIFTAKGPFKKGDTVVATFFITPFYVGVNSVEFSIYENNIGPQEIGYYRPTGSINASFNLSPEGKTIGLASDKSDYNFATGLGPGQDLLANGVYLLIYPKATGRLEYYPEFKEPNFFMFQELVFSVRAFIKPNVGDNPGLDMSFRISPYANFPNGCAILIMHDGGCNLTKIDNSIVGPMDTSVTYDYSLAIELTKPGIRRFTIDFTTPNPDYRTTGGQYSRIKSPVLTAQMDIYIGLNNDNQIVFITDQKPDAGDRKQGMQITPVNEIDPRYEFVKQHPREEYKVARWSPNYKEVMQGLENLIEVDLKHLFEN